MPTADKMKLTVEKRVSSNRGDQPARATSSTFPLTIDLGNGKAPTVGDLKKAVQARVKYLYPSRQRISTSEKKALTDDDKLLQTEGVTDGDTVLIKDLGPQLGWRTVFLAEYFGPLFIHPLFYYYGQTIYRTKFQHSKMQQIALVLVLLHYAKREFETLFVHRFSNGTMPFFNLFKNSAHYWILSGVLLAAAVYGPWASADRLVGTIQANNLFLYSCAGVWAFAELSNLQTHLTLRNLRPAGTKQRNIPRGYGFDLVSCPNYFFEVSPRRAPGFSHREI